MFEQQTWQQGGPDKTRLPFWSLLLSCLQATMVLLRPLLLLLALVVSGEELVGGGTSRLTP